MTEIVGLARRQFRQFKTEMRLRLAYEWRGRRRPQLIHLHVPKTAGTSVNDYLCKRIGWTKTGRSLQVEQMPWTPPWQPGFFDRVRRTPLIYGHMSFALLDRLSTDGHPRYAFTFLREPRARLWSFYGHVHTWLTRVKGKPKAYALWEKCSKLDANQFFTTDDDQILRMIDNLMVRQLAGEMERYPIPDDAWPELVERAKHNVETLDFVGFQETFTQDFSELLRRINIAGPKRPYIKNVTPKRASDEGFEADALLKERIELYTKYDQEVFDFALALYNKGHWQDRTRHPA